MRLQCKALPTFSSWDKIIEVITLLYLTVLYIKELSPLENIFVIRLTFLFIHHSLSDGFLILMILAKTLSRLHLCSNLQIDRDFKEDFEGGTKESRN